MKRVLISQCANLYFEEARELGDISVRYRVFDHDHPYEQVVEPKDYFRIALRLRPGSGYNFELLESGMQQASEFDLPLCVPPGVSIRGWGDAGTEHIIMLLFSAERFIRMTGRDCVFNSAELRALLAVSDRNVIRSLERLADEICNPGPASDVMAESIVNTLIIDLYRCISDADTDPARVNDELASRYHATIERRIFQDGPAPTVADLASLCSISSRQLIRIFKRWTGMTLHDYVEQVRLRRAKEMLARSDLPLKEISYRLGYSAPSSFSIAFRRLTGNSPRVYRRMTRLEPLSGLQADEISGAEQLRASKGRTPCNASP